MIIMFVAFNNVTFAGCKPAATIAEVVEKDKKSGNFHEYHGEKYPIYIGSRGGKYIVVKITRGENKGKYRREYVK